MSTEFEERVLAKLDKIEAKLEEHDKRFDEIDKRFAKQDERFAKQDARFAKQDARFAKQDARFAKQDARFAKQDERFAKQDERFARQDDRLDRQERMIIENSKKIDSLIEAVNVHKNLFIKFEYDFNQKIQTVLDGIASLTEKYAVHDDILMHYSTKLLNHDIRISALEEEKEEYLKK